MKFKKNARMSDNYEKRGKALPMNVDETIQLTQSDNNGPFAGSTRKKRAVLQQEGIASTSPYLTKSTPIKDQKGSDNLETLNYYVNNSEKAIADKTKTLTQRQDTAKPVKLNDVVFPKEYKKKRK